MRLLRLEWIISRGWKARKVANFGNLVALCFPERHMEQVCCVTRWMGIQVTVSSQIRWWSRPELMWPSLQCHKESFSEILIRATHTLWTLELMENRGPKWIANWGGVPNFGAGSVESSFENQMRWIKAKAKKKWSHLLLVTASQGPTATSLICCCRPVNSPPVGWTGQNHQCMEVFLSSSETVMSTTLE